MPGGLAARIKGAVPTAAATPSLAPAVAPRRQARGWSRMRRTLVGAGVANLFLASAVAAAWIAGVPQPVKALFGIETSPPVAVSSAPRGKPVAVPRPRAEAPRELPPTIAPSLGGARDAVMPPPALQPLSTERVVVAGPPPPVRSRPPADNVDRAAELRRVRTTDQPRVAADALRHNAQLPQLSAPAMRDVIEPLRDTARDGAGRPDLPDGDDIRDRIARRDQTLDAPTAGSTIERPQLPDAATLETARAGPTPELPPQVAAPTPPQPPATSVPEKTRQPDRPEQADRPPRRLRERLQRIRPRN